MKYLKDFSIYSDVSNKFINSGRVSKYLLNISVYCGIYVVLN